MNIAQIDNPEIVCFKREVVCLQFDPLGLEKPGFNERIAEQDERKDHEENSPAAAVTVPDLMAAAAEGRRGGAPRSRGNMLSAIGVHLSSSSFQSLSAIDCIIKILYTKSMNLQGLERDYEQS